MDWRGPAIRLSELPYECWTNQMAPVFGDGTVASRSIGRQSSFWLGCGSLRQTQDLSARAEYIAPPNSDGRVASFSTCSTPASVKSWRSRSKPTGYGLHLLGFGCSYSTI